jgi:hypothetical protein
MFDNGKPKGLQHVRFVRPLMATATKVRSLYIGDDGEFWHEGDDIAGGWTCVTESAPRCETMGARKGGR